MKAKGLLICALALVVLPACASRPDLEDRPPFEMGVEPTRSAFLVSLTNPSTYPRCITSESWPTRDGQMHFASERVFVEDDGSHFAIRDENTGYCPGCQIRIAAKSSITASLPYSEFPGLPASPPGPHATLTMPVVETPCGPSS